jgi:hypothetical protein
MNCSACGTENRSGRRFCALARAQQEYAELLARAGRAPDDLEALRDEARAVFESLGAKPWMTRANALHTAVAA